jgi:phosphatidylserine decarboxylase
VSTSGAGYLHHNQRMINKVDSMALQHPYYILQIADYDVDSILPFELKQNQPCDQGHRFSQIRYGSQVDLIIPISERFELVTLQDTGVHVEAGVDPLVRLVERDPNDIEEA